MTWKRTGDCPPERCQGRCCEHVGITFPDDIESRVFLHMMQVRGATVLGGGGKLLLELPQRCQYLTNGLCGLHPAMNPAPELPERPENCSEWPTHPDQLALEKHCGFRFEWVEDEVLTGVT